MTWIVGADGCPKGGWIGILENLETGEVCSRLFPTSEALLLQLPRPSVLAIDIPMGLPDSGARECEGRARKILIQRRSSVFPVPVRPALGASSREEADRLHRAVDGRGVGVQSWHLYGRIREVDRLLQHHQQVAAITYEVHPEVAFTGWNGGKPMAHSKKSRAGRAERLALIRRTFGPSAFDQVRERYWVKEAAHDDILDAFATLWSARRIHAGSAICLPDPPPLDTKGLPMRIVY
ncbi:MAG: DUF429 domain-containing protein [Deltaproteobacteria bacterium]|nr:DUF429 domain-containing protein [Deltaproteobacteria bacterium]